MRSLSDGERASQTVRAGAFSNERVHLGSANKVSHSSYHRSEPGFTLSTLSVETHKSLLAHTHTPHRHDTEDRSFALVYRG